MKAILAIAALLPFLGACDALKDRMGIADPAKIEAEGKAVGGACRHAGRGLEDCYRLNPEADKPAVYAGWKEMNEYMTKNNMQAVTPEIPATPPGKHAAKAEDEAGHGEAAKKDEGHGDKAAETKPAETKPAETKPGEAKAEATGHAADKKAETKPAAEAGKAAAKAGGGH